MLFTSPFIFIDFNIQVNNERARDPHQEINNAISPAAPTTNSTPPLSTISALVTGHQHPQPASSDAQLSRWHPKHAAKWVASQLRELHCTGLLIGLFFLASVPGWMLQSSRSFVSSHPERLETSVMMLSASLTLPTMGCLVLPLFLYANDKDLRAWAAKMAKKMWEKLLRRN